MFGSYWRDHPPLGVGLIVVAMLVATGLLNYCEHTERDKQAAAHEYEETNNVKPVGAAVAKSPYTDPKTYRDEKRSERDLEAQETMAKWAIVSALATIVGIGVLLVTLWETAKAARAAASAAEATEKSLSVSERPWLFAEPNLRTDINRSGDHWRFTIEVDLGNAGRSPAVDIEIHTDICLLSADATQRLRMLCEAAESRERRDFIQCKAVFPTYIERRNVAIRIMRDDIREALNRDQTRFIDPAVIGCVLYKSAFSDETYRVAFIAELRNASNPFMFMPFEVSEGGELPDNVPFTELALTNVYRSKMHT